LLNDESFTRVSEVRAESQNIALFKKIVEQSYRVKNIDAEIEQHILTGSSPKELFCGRYRADNRGNFRIDYSKPSRQMVLFNSTGLFWYYPDDNLVYEINSGTGSIKPAVNPLKEFSGDIEKMFRVQYLGRTIYGFFNIAHQFVIVNRKKGLNHFIWIDASRDVVLKKILKDRNGRELVREKYGNHRKVKGIWIPGRVDVYARSEEGLTVNVTIYKHLILNSKMNGAIFNCSFPPDAERRTIER